MIRLFCMVALLGSSVAYAGGRPGQYYLVVRGVQEGDGVTSGILPELKTLFLAELKKHSELTLEAPAGLPADPEALHDELAKRKIRALEVTLRVLGVTSTVNPPRDGKQFRVLQRGVKLSVFGSTIPENVVAIGGNGESTVGTEIGKTADVEREGKPLLLDAAKEAIRQAVDMTVTKLNLAAKSEAAGPKKPKKKK